MTINASKTTLLILTAVFASLTLNASAATPNFSDYPLSTTGQAGVQPNIMFTLDDSGSMGWDYLPDWATLYTDANPANLVRLDNPVAQQDLFRNPQYNGLAYNPATRYLPPYYLNLDGTANTTTYPSMTGLTIKTGADLAYPLPNWRAVPADAYGVQTLAPAGYIPHGGDNTCPDGTFNSATCNLEQPNNNVTPSVPYAFSYKFYAGEYCTDKNQTDCQIQFGPTSSRSVESVLRWCTTQNDQTDCQALFDDTGKLLRPTSGNKYTFPRVAGKATGNTYKSLITVSSCTACSVSKVTINGTDYPLPATNDLSASTQVSGITSASDLASKLYNVLPKAIPGLGVSDLTTNTFYVYLPVSSAPNLSFAATGATFSYASWSTSSTNLVGANVPTYISSSVNQYPRSGDRTDCISAPPVSGVIPYCTYAEEMTNYANWLAYYRTRLQTMKTAASNAFSTINSRYRVGYFTISRNSFINPDSFQTSKKKAWYDNLFATDAPLANATPLRAAISRIGQLYAGTHNGETWGTGTSSATVVDPMQYYCTKNFDILATDGYWNTNNETSDASGNYGPYAVDNTTLVNQQDGGPGSSAGTSPWIADPGLENRPQYDGQHPVATRTVSQTTATATQWSRTDGWSEQVTDGYKQQYWNARFDVKTYGFVQTSTSYSKTVTAYTYTQTSTPWTNTATLTDYTYTKASTPWTWTATNTLYNYNKASTPWTNAATRTDYTYSKASTPWTNAATRTDYTYSKTSTPWTNAATRTDYTYSKASTPWTYSVTITPLTYTKTTYTGIPTYSYNADGTNYSGKSYCPSGVTCTTQYLSYTSSQTAGLLTCSGSGSVGQSTYSTCSGLTAGSAQTPYYSATCPSSTTNQSVSCTVQNGSTTTTTVNDGSTCTASAGSASSSTAYSDGSPKVVCTQHTASAATTYGTSCAVGTAPGASGGTAATIITACAVQSGSTTTTTVNDGSTCTAGAGSASSSTAYSDGSPKVVCTQQTASAATTYGTSCAVGTAPSASGGTAATIITACNVANGTTTNTTVTTCAGAAGSASSSTTYTDGSPKIVCTLQSTAAGTTVGSSCLTGTIPGSTGGTGGTVVTACTVTNGPTTNTTITDGNTCTASAGTASTSTAYTDGTPKIVCTRNSTAAGTANGTTCATGTTPGASGGTAATIVSACSISNGTGVPVTIPIGSTCTQSPGTAGTSTAASNGGTPKVTCTRNTGSPVVTTEPSCSPVSAPAVLSGTSGSATSTNAVACVGPTATKSNITSGVCSQTTTATAVITCSSLQVLTTASNQATCPGTPVSTPKQAGDETCTGFYVAGNLATDWVAACGTASAYHATIPTYGTGIGNYSTDAVAYAPCTHSVSGAVLNTGACSSSGPTPSVTCTSKTNPTTHPASCTAGSISVAGYTNGLGVAIAGGTGSYTCSNATLYSNQPVDPTSCIPDGVARYDTGTGSTITCIKAPDEVTSGLKPADCTTLPPNSGNQFKSTTCTPGLDGGSLNSLADVTEYYYRTDLRPATSGRCTGSIVNSSTNNVCVNNSTGTTVDERQNMSTYTLGLGLSGQMLYSPKYPEETAANPGDFYNISQGTAATASSCRWNKKDDPCNWPVPETSTMTTIDDLWHAGVNGRGKYFSADNPSSLVSSLSSALSGISIKVGAGSGAATSNLQPVQGDNYAYVASFETQTWVGDLQARVIDIVTGKVASGLDSNQQSHCDVTTYGCLWSAQTVLDTQNGTIGGKNTSSSAPSSIASNSTRSIYLEPLAGSTTMRSFNYAAMSSSEKAFFTNGITAEVDLNWLIPVMTNVSNVATNLVDYLAGSRTYESNGFRYRKHILGDIVDSAPVFVGKPAFSYGDAGYSTYKNANTARLGVVYVLANDGMLHAFDATTGKENWAFVPKAVLPQIYTLAKASYSHLNLLDGKITVGDAYFQGASESSPSWHTVLVAGYGKGGSGYFALDITDPTVPPTFLWSVDSSTSGFSNLGYSYGNAAITKLPDGRWITLFSSGYNNPDGHGYLYAVNVSDGTMMSGFPFTTKNSDGGSPSNPSNLGQVSTWVDIPNKDNSAYFVYTGDFLGNVWRFDLGTATTTTITADPCTGIGSIHNCTTGQTVFKLAELKAPDGSAQPITTHIETTTHDGKYRLVFVATGSYLTTTDAAVTQTQSTYAIKDTLEDLSSNSSAQSTYIDPRNLTTATTPAGPLFLPRYLVADTLADGTPIRSTCDTTNCASAGSTVDWTKQAGWYVDYPELGERVNIDMILSLGTLLVASNVPASNACESGGHSWTNYLDYASGLSIMSNITGKNYGIGISSNLVSDALAVGLNVIQLQDNSVEAIVSLSSYKTEDVQPVYAPAPFMNKLDSWRDIETY